jgi:hypothetical protein
MGLGPSWEGGHKISSPDYPKRSLLFTFMTNWIPYLPSLFSMSRSSGPWFHHTSTVYRSCSSSLCWRSFPCHLLCSRHNSAVVKNILVRRTEQKRSLGRPRHRFVDDIVTWSSDYRRDLDWQLEYVQIVTTSNYSSIANSHTLQFTAARTKSF